MAPNGQRTRPEEITSGAKRPPASNRAAAARGAMQELAGVHRWLEGCWALLTRWDKSRRLMVAEEEQVWYWMGLTVQAAGSAHSFFQLWSRTPFLGLISVHFCFFLGVPS